MEEFFAKLLTYLPSLTSVAACFTAVITCIKAVGSKTKDSLTRITEIKDQVVSQNKVNEEVLNETKETKNDIKQIASECQIQINETSNAIKKMADLTTKLSNLSNDINVLKKQYSKKQNKGE